MNRQQAKSAIRSRVVVNVQHIKSLHSIDEVIDQLCDEHDEQIQSLESKLTIARDFITDNTYHMDKEWFKRLMEAIE
jgi:hypothetical protein